jgi:hypothetical protein
MKENMKYFVTILSFFILSLNSYCQDKLFYYFSNFNTERSFFDDTEFCNFITTYEIEDNFKDPDYLIKNDSLVKISLFKEDVIIAAIFWDKSFKNYILYDKTNKLFHIFYRANINIIGDYVSHINIVNLKGERLMQIGVDFDNTLKYFYGSVYQYKNGVPHSKKFIQLKFIDDFTQVGLLQYLEVVDALLFIYFSNENDWVPCKDVKMSLQRFDEK